MPNGVGVEVTGQSDHRQAVANVIGILQQKFSDRCATSAAMREQHAHTTTWLTNQPPDAVVFAQSTGEVAEVVRTCSEFKVPVIPFGTGTSLEGHVNAPLGGISIDLTGMNRVLEVNAEDLDCRVEAGVTRKQLNSYIRDTGLFFPIDPGADASIGGMAATRASGTNAVRYGTMKDAVLGLTVVTADGAIVRTGGRVKKSSAGYDLTRLLVGSEGTLGVITEITLKLHGQPEAISGGVCAFPSVQAACNAVIMTIQMGIPVARIELLDALQVKACNNYSKLELDETPTLFLEFHGSEAGVREQSETFSSIAEECDGGPFKWATVAEERSKLWAARHDAYWSGKALRPEADMMVTDVCVPISRLADCVRETAEDISASGLIAPIVGHVGDGNFHTQVLIDLSDPEEIRKGEAFVERLTLRALSMGGTCTGEHGVGQGKQKYMAREHGDALNMMRAIKVALDPENLMNPGKILPQS